MAAGWSERSETRQRRWPVCWVSLRSTQPTNKYISACVRFKTISYIKHIEIVLKRTQAAIFLFFTPYIRA
ncbi:MAG: hypothetical protein Q4G71_12380 [Pseudomonadota bacterium]|nr:hypothetical protein [Pseudomonadota bacterium]